MRFIVVALTGLQTVTQQRGAHQTLDTYNFPRLLKSVALVTNQNDLPLLQIFSQFLGDTRVSNYQEERSDPSTPTCGPARSFLYFNGDFLVLLGPKTNTPFPAVSGSRNDKGLFDYSVERQ